MSSLNPTLINQIIEFLNIAEKLKCEMRHSWLSSGRQESVAEHTWRMSLMIPLFAPYLSQPIDLEKCLKMAILHDLAEAEVGDIPVFEIKTLEEKERKQASERTAMVKICAALPDETGKDFLSLWEEYEEKKSYEALFINALDKIEVHLQHVEASLSTWTGPEREMLFQDKWLLTHCRFEPSLFVFAKEILGIGIKKLEAAGENVSFIQQRATSS
ncbi:MAG: HD domain-containing protein [Proteobacteria bacterium]|nr:HD domain-containing protein [Pseudomonadota bacterium]